MIVTEGTISREEASAFKAIWKCTVPSKVTAFMWRVLHDRIQTKVNLFKRHVLQKACASCRNSAETSVHLLLYYNFATRVWQHVMDWLGIVFRLPHNLYGEQLLGSYGDSGIRLFFRTEMLISREWLNRSKFHHGNGG
jgi:hypothetical protein